MQRILVVDDEPAVVDVVEFALRKAGYGVVCVASVADAKAALAADDVALMVLDLGLPDGDGLDLCRGLQADIRLPTIILTCRDEEIDRILGLESGADDYVVKPFSPRELVARVRSVLRRAQASRSPSADSEIRHGTLVLNPEQHRVRLNNVEVVLTPVEFDLLHALLRSPERVFSRGDLVERVYQGEAFVSDRTIDSHVKGIRRRFAAVDPDCDPIETVFGVGYRASEAP